MKLKPGKACVGAQNLTRAFGLRPGPVPSPSKAESEAQQSRKVAEGRKKAAAPALLRNGRHTKNLGKQRKGRTLGNWITIRSTNLSRIDLSSST